MKKKNKTTGRKKPTCKSPAALYMRLNSYEKRLRKAEIRLNFLELERK